MAKSYGAILNPPSAILAGKALFSLPLANAGTKMAKSRTVNGQEFRRYPQSSILYPRWRIFDSRLLPHYVRGGKTPCNAMQKFSVRSGIMLLCGALPPVGAKAWGAIVLSPDVVGL